MMKLVKGPHEILEIYDLEGTFLGTETRSNFYAEIENEFAKTGKITKKVKSIRVMLMSSDGRLYLQKRSKLKVHNSGLYDKTAGGHFMCGHTWEMTVVREMVEELGIPSVVLPAQHFAEAVKTTDLSIIGIFKEIDYDPHFISIRTTTGKPIEQPFMTMFYFGYYDGFIRFHDGEASGIEVYSLEELEPEIKAHPERYTRDLQHMIEKYRKFLVPINRVS